MIGTEIGNYRILEKLGEGGMGVVYKALDTSLDRVVALKALTSDLARNPELEQRFRAEARAQAGLNHTNLATLYAFLVQDGTAWMVMEYIEGETFEQMIRRRGPIPSQEAIPLFKQALLGMGFAHRAGIVHRDIKPSNIMLSRNGIVKVMDFGIAKVLGARGMTRTGTQMGTAFYMAPEQVLNKPVDIRSDIYSLGVSLYEMLAGRVPFESDSDYQVMSDHVNASPPAPTRFYPYIPKGLEAAVLKALEKSPDARFQSVEEFGAALERPQDFVAAPAAAEAATVFERAPRSTPPPAPAPVVIAPMEPAAAKPNVLGTPMRKAVAAGALAVMLLGGAWLGFRPTPTPPTPAPHVNPSPGPSGGSSGGEIVIPPPPAPVENKEVSGELPKPADQTKAPPQEQPKEKPSEPAKEPVARTPVIVAPAGSLVSIRTIETIDTRRNHDGDRISASLDAPIIVKGRIAVPRGSNARLALSNVKNAKISGRSEVNIQLVGVSVNGRNYPVSSSVIVLAGPGRGGGSAKVIGGMAAAGAIVGGLIHGKKGAAGGAATGAVGGTLVRGLGPGDPITVLSETPLQFTLRSPIRNAP
jgi:serine/threonine protein kinase